MSVQSWAASLLSAQQQTNAALATINFDFSIVKVEAPAEFKPLGQQLAARRLKNAESGSHHVTARKLGALFQHALPATPNLIRAYGTRASDIASRKSVSAEASRSYGIFAEHVGVDATNIWAAATSGPEAIAVHLLACMLARLWESREATSIWVELVAERKGELGRVLETEPGYHASVMASQISLSREQLAEWDASARAWLRTADEAMMAKQKQFMLMLEGVRLPVNGKPALFQSVVHAWKSAMMAAENLIKGIPQSIQDGAVLLGLSSWHIYPDLLVLSGDPTRVSPGDPLVAEGGILTIGLHMQSDKEGGVFWSLPLAQLRYYGGPVLAEKSLDTEGDRITVMQLFQVVAGSLSRGWGTDMLELARLLTSLWEYVSPYAWKFTSPGTAHWLGTLQQALEPLFGDDALARKTCKQLMEFGRRRCPDFLVPDGTSRNIPKLFGILEAKTYFSFLRSPDDRVLAMRQYAAGLPKANDEILIIRYSVQSGDGREFEYATAIPAKRETYKRAHDDSCSASEGHTRWVATMALRRQEYVHDASRSEAVEKLGEDSFSVESEMIRFQDHRTFRWARLPSALVTAGGPEPDAFREVDIETWDEEAEEFASKADFRFVTGDLHTCALFTSGRRREAVDHAPRGEDAQVSSNVFLAALGRGQLRPKAVLSHLGHFLLDESRSHLLRSLRALATVNNIYKMLPDATVSLKIAARGLYDMPWIDTPSSAPPAHMQALQLQPKVPTGETSAPDFAAFPMDWARTFSCIALLESGSFAVRPETFKRVMAMSIADSLYIAAPLVCDPSETPLPYEVRRVRGNVGKPGIALVVPPETTSMHQPGFSDWQLVSHASFDGRLEDSFRKTTLHLSFTGYALPVDVGTYGCQDSEMYFLESVVSVHDGGRWVADLDILRHLGGMRFRRLDAPCKHATGGPNSGNSGVVENPKLTAIDHWSELLDRPPNAAVVRARGNWLARLAATTLSLQLGHPTVAVSEDFCWRCTLKLWDDWWPELTGSGREDAGQPVLRAAVDTSESWQDAAAAQTQEQKTDFEKDLESRLRRAKQGGGASFRGADDVLDEMRDVVIIC